ncbi:MAG: putative sulfate/molybdate transporter, partial [Bacteroidetes bacterium]|nr:putative sulfate/molybdate transporter [Bacteroidota bacterium]
MLPLAFALVVFNGFGISRLFLLWGVMYILTGWLYKVPVSVQPLKAMAVIAISSGISIEMLSGTSFFYGILLIVLSLTGAIRWLQKWFSPALVKGIQLGIGLILAQKAIEMVIEKGFLLFGEPGSMQMNFLILLLLLPFLWVFQFRKKIPIALILIFVSIVIIKLWGDAEPVIPKETSLDFMVPKFSILLDAFFLLIIPQLPLTIGNAMFAASDACHSMWGKQAERVNPTRFGLSIGIGNSVIGLLGGFPMCHGAGGIAAH